jgi:hypothetical protein
MRLTAILVLFCAVASSAQNLQLRQLDTGAADISAHVGDTLTIELVTHLGALRASGVALNISLPAQGLTVIDRAPARPFVPALFADGLEFANRQVAASRVYGLPADAALLTYAVVMGPGDVRYRSGSAALASFDVVCTAPVTGIIRLVDSAAHQSMIVLDDGRSERAFQQATEISLTIQQTVDHPDSQTDNQTDSQLDDQAAAKRSIGSWADIKSRIVR